MAKLNVKAYGLACGILWGAAMLIIGLVNTFSNWGAGIEELMATVYIGYSSTILGSIIGGIWGFVDAGVGGAMLAWMYNKFQK